MFNGLLLSPNLDAAFDGGLITVAEDGRVVVSGLLQGEAGDILGVATPLRVERLTGMHRKYLEWHRQRVFRGN